MVSKQRDIQVAEVRSAALVGGRRWKTSGPLAGVKVLDLTRVLAGPFATMLLGDLGADVIKVERPGTGDDTREWGPPFVGTESTYFLSVNRNKKSIAVNMQDSKGADIVQQLAMQSDILMENYLPGKLDKFGLGYDQLKEVAPSLIYCSITGYGPGGPHGQKAGYDVVASAVGGLMHITGPEDGDPCKVGVAMTDMATGLYAHGAVMAALIGRQKTGMGQKIDCSLLASQVSTLSHIATSYLTAGFQTGRYGTAHHSIVPYQAFKTRDGYLVVAGGNDKLFKQMCEVLDLKELAKDPMYSTNGLRVQNRKKLVPIIEKRFMEKSTAEWEKLLEGTSLPSGPINDIKQVFEDPQVQYKKLVQEFDHPTAGTVRMPGPAVEYNGGRTLVDSTSPPLLGQHTAQVLRQYLGYSDSEISALKDRGVITCSETQT